MLYITVELWPGGHPARSRKIATMSIANISNLSDISSYRVVANEVGSAVTGLTDQTHEFQIDNHPRYQSVFAILAKAAQKFAELTKPTPGKS